MAWAKRGGAAEPVNGLWGDGFDDVVERIVRKPLDETLEKITVITKPAAKQLASMAVEIRGLRDDFEGFGGSAIGAIETGVSGVMEKTVATPMASLRSDLETRTLTKDQISTTIGGLSKEVSRRMDTVQRLLYVNLAVAIIAMAIAIVAVLR